MTDTPQFDFGEALRRLRDRKRVRRAIWPREYAWLQAKHSVSRAIACLTDNDILATDWVEVSDATEKQSEA